MSESGREGFGKYLINTDALILQAPRRLFLRNAVCGLLRAGSRADSGVPRVRAVRGTHDSRTLQRIQGVSSPEGMRVAGQPPTAKPSTPNPLS